jgi:mono/diheme cytochrome c family protein
MQLTHYTSYLTGLKTVVVLFFLFISWNTKKTAETTALEGELAEGQKLALKYCSTCHLPVDPTLLDKETWKNQVLPAMAKKLGLEVWQ